ncbi:MAG: cell division FtsA domain-containing protein [Bacilli bacterium]|nr:cell division FtsA domain-containing protein [Bacilli bacterium]
MEKPTAAIEISSAEIKLVVGYEIDGQPIVLYAMRKPIDAFVERGQIVNLIGLIDALREIKEIKDATAKLKLTISEAILLLPPLGLEVYQSDKTTNVVSPTGTVEAIDISNVVSLVRKEVIPHGGQIIDIVPDAFALDNGVALSSQPLGEKSNSLSISAKIHALPFSVIENFRRAFKEADIVVKRALVAPHAATYLLAQDLALPTSYLLIDMGAEVTTVSLIGDRTLFSSTYFEKGGKDLTTAIMASLNLPFDEAEKLKRRYGIDHRSMSFYPTIAQSVDIEGVEKQYTTEDLNRVTEQFVYDYLVSLKQAINSLMSGYDKKYLKMPFVISGGLGRLSGLDELIIEAFPDNKIHFCIPKAIGARHQTYVNTLGAILANNRYQSYLEEDRPVVTPLTRGGKEAKERK